MIDSFTVLHGGPVEKALFSHISYTERLATLRIQGLESTPHAQQFPLSIPEKAIVVNRRSKENDINTRSENGVMALSVSEKRLYRTKVTKESL